MTVDPAPVPLPGALIDDRYRVGPVIGRGAMSDVYRATDERVGRTVAVKVLRTDCAEPVRFAEETKLLRDLDHPNLVRLLDTGVHERAPYLVLNLFHETLTDRLHHGPIDPALAARIGGEIASALAYLHAMGIVHRDVKPSNVLLRADGSACLADLGAALSIDGPRHTVTGLTIGTPMYLAPEQATGEPVTGRADVYALGLVLLEATTGEIPFDGTQTERLAARITRPPEIPPSLPTELRAALAPMVAVHADARPDAAAVATELVRVSVAPTVHGDGAVDATVPIPLLDDAPATQVLTAPIGSGPTSERPRSAGWLAVAAAIVALALVALVWRGGAGSPGVGDAATTTTTVPTTTSTASPAAGTDVSDPVDLSPVDPNPCGPGCDQPAGGGKAKGKAKRG